MHRTNPARSAAAVLTVVWALAVPAAGGLISDVGAIPNPFSPNADGVFDSTAVYYSLSEQAAVVVAVADSAGIGFLTLWSGWEDEGTHSHWWDGWFEDSFVADGEYQFLIKAIPELPLLDVEVAPSRFSPNGDGVGDSLMIRFEAGISEPSDQVLVTVLDENAESVRLVYSATGVASAILFWNGDDEEGAVASDGLFFVKVETRDAAGNGDWSGALVDLDTSPPVLGVDYTDTTAMEIRVDSSVAELTGWAFDRAGVVSVEMSVDQEEWIEVALGRPDTVTWAGSLACESCVPDSLDEVLEVFVRGRDGTPTADGQGHVNGPEASVPILSFDVIFDVAPPEHVSSTVSGGDDVFEPGEIITVTTMWDDTGYDVSADFSQVDSEFDPTDVGVSEGTGGHYTITYEISQANSFVPVTDAPVAITATDYFGRSVADTTLTVTVLPGTSGGPTGGIAVDVNSFEPLAAGKVTITLGSYEGTATVRIYNMTGTHVRTLEGSSSISWYGDNDAGDSVASGVYFLRIQMGGSESVKKVAVIR